MHKDDLVLRPKEWVRFLLQPENYCAVDLAGFPGYYIFENGLQMRVSGLAQHLLHFVTEGKMLVHTEMGEFSVVAGSMCVLSPHIEAYYSSQDMGALGVCRFRFTSSSELQNVCYPQNFLFADRVWHLQSAVEEVLQQHGNEGELSQQSVRGALVMICSNLFQLQNREKRKASGLTPLQVRRVREYYHRTHKSWPTPADLAHHAGLSLDYFTRLFRYSFGVSPRKWLVQERIRLSRILLSQSIDTVEAVARKLGYSDHRLFVRQFKQCSGCTPTQFRRTRTSQ